MLHYEFMRHAFAASALVAVLAGPVGWFLVLRGQAFAGHALSHVGFAGAAAALWLGMPPLAGMIIAALLGGVAMGQEGRHAPLFGSRDTMIGLVLAASLGLGLFCLQRVNAPGGATTALLFGDVLGVDDRTLWALVAITVVSLTVLAVICRPLLFASLDRDASQAAGVPVSGIAMVFMGVTALGVAACTEVTGVLLTFSLLVGPAACLLRLGASPMVGLTGSAALALGLAWGGLAASWWTDAPVAFWIGMGSVACYGMAIGITSRRSRR